MLEPMKQTLAPPPNLTAGLIASAIVAVGGTFLIALPGMALLSLADWIGGLFDYNVEGPMGPSALGVALLISLAWIWPFVPAAVLLHRRYPRMRRWVRGLTAFSVCVFTGVVLGFLFSLLSY